MKSLTAVLIYSIIWINEAYRTNAQIDICVTPNNYYGGCVLLPNCPSLVNYFGNSKGSQQGYNFLIGSQRSCGTRSYNGEPIVCCQEAYRPPTTTQRTFPPTRAPNPPVTRQPTPPVTRQPTPPVTNPPTRPITVQPVPEIATTKQTTYLPPTITETEERIGGCRGPDLKEGNCIELNNCPVLLNRLIQNPKDQEFIQFLQLSNTLCNQRTPIICCPVSADDRTNPPIRITTDAPITESPGTSSSEQVLRLPTVDENCGFTNGSFNRIIGGEPAKLGAWPWMALLGYVNGLNERSFKCGGSLITRRHILTAAHCINSELTFVRLGEYDLSTDSETQHVEINIAKVYRHPAYSKRDGHSDVAVLALKRPIQQTYFIRPVCLPVQQQYKTKNYVNFYPFIAGWGRTQEGGMSAEVLQQLQIPILENSVCRDRYKAKNRLISEKQFDGAIVCAGVLEGGKDSCQGDSGGPLMFPEQINGKFHMFEIGIVSYGIGCARVDVPGVYASVQHFVDWIQQQVALPVT